MASTPLPTQEQLRQLFSYNPKTGALTWMERPISAFKGKTPGIQKRAAAMWNKCNAGRTAGALTPDFYISVKIHDRSYGAHRLIWAMLYGDWPETIDHINGNPSDNRLSNLRSATRSMNQRNQKRHRSNKSGRTGVYLNWRTGLWVAHIKMNDVSHNLGAYNTFEEAVRVRERAERENGFTGRQ